MRLFAKLLDELVFTPSRNGKLALLGQYFRDAPDPDRGWALAALTDGLPLRLPLRRILGELMEQRQIDPVLYKLSRDFVGDTAETVALLWPDPDPIGVSAPALSEVVEQIRSAPKMMLAATLGGFLDRFDARERWAFLKLLGGAARVGVSARLAKTALAHGMGRDVAEIEEVWHGLTPPYAALFAWLEGGDAPPQVHGGAIFRPMMLAHPIAETEWSEITPGEFAAEWKWDGIRVQIAATKSEVRVFSRTGDDVSAAFPDIAASFVGRDVTADGELLVCRETAIAPFADLQQRLNRKAVTARMQQDYPAHVRLYDLLSVDGEDLRALAFDGRRERLEVWHRQARPPRTDLSELIAFQTVADLARIRADCRAGGIEGLMLKRRASPYLAGRPKGHWFKWKRDALLLDCVLMYAQRGSGKRSSLYSDLTFGVWRESATGAAELVPVGKAYSGFTDIELGELDRFIRQNTVETFGPVRSVKQQLVLEVAFDALQRSPRHKSGLAMRFPRISRIRWDKPALEADTLANALDLLDASPQAG